MVFDACGGSARQLLEATWKGVVRCGGKFPAVFGGEAGHLGEEANIDGAPFERGPFTLFLEDLPWM